MKFLKFIPFALVGFLIVVVFKNWLLTDGIASGDFWYYFPSMFENFSLYPYAWYTFTVDGLGGTGFVYQNGVIMSSVILWIVKNLGIQWELANKLFFYCLFLILSLLSSIFLIKKFFPENKFWILAPIIFTFNTYILMVVGGGQIITALSYSLIPFSLYLFVKLADSKAEKKKIPLDFILTASFIFFFQCVLDLRIAFVEGIAVLIYILVNFIARESKPKSLIYILLVFLLAGLMSAYWVIPVLIYGINPIEQLGFNYSSTEIVKFLSFAKLENTITLLHPYWPENIFGKIGFMKPEFLLLPTLAFSSLLFFDMKKGQKKTILYFVVLALIGIFLGKGASDPFGNSYIWLFENVPGFQLFRDSFKWYTLIALSYSILIPYVVWSVYDWLGTQPKFQISNSRLPKPGTGGQVRYQIKTKYRIINFQNLFVVFVLGYLLFLIKPAVFGELGGTFKSRDLPKEYVLLDGYLSKDKAFFRTLWIPNTMLFGHYTNQHPQISARDFFNQYDNKMLLGHLASLSSKQVLEKSSVKYVIIPADTENEIYLTERKYDDKKYKQVVNQLNRVPWLKKDKEFGKIVVYKTNSHKDRFWCDCDGQISYKYINPTEYEVSIKNAKKGDILIFSEAFDKNWIAESSRLPKSGTGGQAKFKVYSSKFGDRFNSFILPSDGDYDLKVNYSPQKIVNFGVLISLITISLSAGALLIILVKSRRK